MTRTGPSPLEWTVFFRIVDSCAEKSVSSAKSSSTYIVMGTEVGLHSRIDDDFLNKEEAAWNEHYPMAAFEFDPTPKEDWAKQVLYDHKPFDNTIHSGSRVISPRAYFAIRNPMEGDMRKMLQNLSFEKQFLGEMNSLTNTQIKVNRRPSEGFAAPAVPMAEVLTAKQTIDKFGVTPVDQTKDDDAQLKNLDGAAAIDDPAALRIVYQKEADRTLKTPDGETFVLEDTFSEDEFAAITSQVTTAEGKTVTNHDYTNYVVPARQAYAHQTTVQHPGALIGFIALLLVVLVAMATFRSPAVALMPDVTIKPLRSKANAVINLMGTAGGILVLAIGMAFATSSVRNSLMSYTAYFAVIAGIMLVALLIFRLTVNEPKFVAEMQADSKRFGIDNGDSDDAPAGSGKLGKAERRSLIFLLLSIVLWFFGYNAVTSKYSVYASNILHKDYNLTLMLAQAAAIVAYLPVGIVASKIGRKKTILGGVVMLAVAFGVAAFLNAESPTMLMNAMFCLAGIGWATINVNSFPMVVEMCSGSDVGRYTGFYYTASMAAQVVTPMFSGFLMDKLGMTVLFPYAAIFVAGAFVTMLFVRHGDSRPIPAKGLEALDVDD